MASEADEPIPMQSDEKAIPLEVEDEALPLVAGDDSGGPSKIQTFGAAAFRTEKKEEFKRPLNLTGTGATRVRLFNSKITVAAVDHLIGTINEWLDGEQIDVKTVNQVIGTVEGKKPEPNIIITVWY